jgi:hypothetical protein
VDGGRKEQTKYHVSFERVSPVVSCSPAVLCLASACAGACACACGTGFAKDRKRRARKFSRLACPLVSVSLRAWLRKLTSLPSLALLQPVLEPYCACGTGFTRDRRCLTAFVLALATRTDSAAASTSTQSGVPGGGGGQAQDPDPPRPRIQADPITGFLLSLSLRSTPCPISGR